METIDSFAMLHQLNNMLNKNLGVEQSRVIVKAMGCIGGTICLDFVALVHPYFYCFYEIKKKFFYGLPN